MFSVSNLGKMYPTKDLFKAVTFKLTPVDRIGLIGPNGSGKTTLLRMLIGELKSDEGNINQAKDVVIGYLPQETVLESNLTIIEETLTGARRMAKIKQGLDDVLEASLADHSSLDRYGQLITEFEQFDGYELESKAKKNLIGLGFSQDSFDQPCKDLSGGWKMRLNLAKLLLENPDILLLDEPTNHLDLPSIAWLEQYLRGYEGAVLIVSHDRYFLNRIVLKIAALNHQTLKIYPGNYDEYLLLSEEDELQQKKKIAVQEERREQLENFVERFRAKATKAKQVQSKIRLIEKMETIAPIQKTRQVRFRFPQPEPSGRKVVEFRDVAKSYGPVGVYEHLSFLIERGERLALIGPNGAGKSTTLKLLAGKIVPSSGIIELGHKVERFYYSQHIIDELEPGRRAYDELVAYLPERGQTELRSALGSFGLTGDQVFTRIVDLSGGEKAKVALAKLLLKPANFLLLDEPTNHLDLAGRESLESSLASYDGTICFVSHDRMFIEKIATAILDFVGDGTIVLHRTGYADYLEWKIRREEEVTEGSSISAPGSEDPSEKKQRKRLEAEQRNLRFARRKVLENELEEVETAMIAIEERIKAIDLDLSTSKIYNDPDMVRTLASEKKELRERLIGLDSRWNELTDLVEELQKEG